jgi:hypothetical protein
MGRGRQKAKQTKVARDLKYQVQDIDTAALQRELGASPANGYRTATDDSDDDSEDDQYAGYASYLDEDDEDDGYKSASSRR